MMERITGALHTFCSIDTVDDIDNATMLPTEFLNSLNPSGLPEHKLKLKTNTVEVFLQNMDIYTGHCNGTRCLVKVIGQYRVILHMLDIKDDDKTRLRSFLGYHVIMEGKTSHLSSSDLHFP